MRATTHGYLFLGLTSVPPTILLVFFTPHLQTELEGEDVEAAGDGVEGDEEVEAAGDGVEDDEAWAMLDITGGEYSVYIGLDPEESQG